MHAMHMHWIYSNNNYRQLLPHDSQATKDHENSLNPLAYEVF